MKNEDLFDSLQEIDEKFIYEAAPKSFSNKKKYNFPLKAVLSTAACAVLVAGAAVFITNYLKSRGALIEPNDGNTSDNSSVDFFEPSDAEQVFDLSDYAGDGDPVKNFKLEEFPELDFVCSQTAITEIGKNFEHYVGSGMPITSVYTVDLNGDDNREIAYNWSLPTGLSLDCASVYDVKNNKFYTVATTGSNGCRLELRDNKLYFNEYSFTNPNETTVTALLTMSTLSEGAGGAYFFTGDYNNLTRNPLDKPASTDSIAFFYDLELGKYDAVVYGHFVGRPCQPTDPNAPADENTERVGMQNNFCVDEVLGGTVEVSEGEVITVYGPCFVSDGGQNLSYKFESGIIFAPFTEGSEWIMYLKRTADVWNGYANAVIYLPRSYLDSDLNDVLDELRDYVPDRNAKTATVFYDNGKCVDDWIEFKANVGDRYYYKTSPEGGMTIMDMDTNIYKSLGVDKICAIYLYDFDGDGKREMVCAENPAGDTYKVYVHSETQNFTSEIDKDDELCVYGDNLCVHSGDKYTPLENYLDVAEQTENPSDSSVKTVFNRYEEDLPKGNNIELTLDDGQAVRIGLDETYPESISLKGHEENLFYTSKGIVMVYLADVDGDSKRELVVTTSGADYKILFIYSSTVKITRKIPENLEIQNGQLCLVNNGEYTPLDKKALNAMKAEAKPEEIHKGTLPSGGIKFTTNETADTHFELREDGLYRNDIPGSEYFMSSFEERKVTSSAVSVEPSIVKSPYELILEDLNKDGTREFIIASTDRMVIYDVNNDIVYKRYAESSEKLAFVNNHAVITDAGQTHELMDYIWETEAIYAYGITSSETQNYDHILKPNLDPKMFGENITAMEYCPYNYYALYYGYSFTAAPGSKVYAPATGTIDYVSKFDDGGGKFVILGDDGRYYFIFDLSNISDFSEGDRITAGTVLGQTLPGGTFAVTCTVTFPGKRY